MTSWVSLERASDLTGLPVSHFHKRAEASGSYVNWPTSSNKEQGKRHDAN
ncbi:hypothetical protein DR66_2351 [Delftia acidovorans]|nr:hypothetical protein DR66_2351 [Delftia acidovorans]